MLAQIFAPIHSELDRFEERLEQALVSDVGLVQKMANHLMQARGKRVRPALSLLSAQAVGECSDRVIDAAVGIEIIQTATLIHDDVIDLAETRRGAEVLNIRWGNQAAILMGDFLLVRALQILVSLKSQEVMEAATRATRRIIEGEILETRSASQARTDAYFTMIDKKTASLMALCCEVGAILGGGTPAQIRQMSTFGKEVGIAFQITDDLLDFVGNETVLGKPVGNDVREKKLTLPLLRALSNCPNGEAGRIQTKVLTGIETEEDLQEVFQFVERYRGFEEAREEARTYANAAIEALGVLSPSEARNALELSVQYVVDRER